MPTKKVETITILISSWGKDHWSLLVYCETRAVDYKGFLGLQHLRINAGRRGFSNGAGISTTKWNPEWATRLPDLSKPDPSHDDIDVLDDLEREGFLKNNFTILNPRIELTEKGKEICSKIRAHKMAGGTFNTFKP